MRSARWMGRFLAQAERVRLMELGCAFQASSCRPELPFRAVSLYFILKRRGREGSCLVVKREEKEHSSRTPGFSSGTPSALSPSPLTSARCGPPSGQAGSPQPSLLPDSGKEGDVSVPGSPHVLPLPRGQQEGKEAHGPVVLQRRAPGDLGFGARPVCGRSKCGVCPGRLPGSVTSSLSTWLLSISWLR